ncbi:MAG TPA: hypothetical protein VFR12_00945 [Pyrinomonadaceae bacterium]|nr:hypothetical protein [Pyrinomonadaceae bacterium]
MHVEGIELQKYRRFVDRQPATVQYAKLTLAGTVARFRSLTLERFERKMQESRDRHLIPFPSRNGVSIKTATQEQRNRA